MANFTCIGINDLLVDSNTTGVWACGCDSKITSEDCLPQPGNQRSVSVSYNVDATYCSNDASTIIVPISPSEVQVWAAANNDLYLAELADSGFNTTSISNISFEVSTAPAVETTNSNKGVVIGLTSGGAAVVFFLLMWYLSVARNKSGGDEVVVSGGATGGATTVASAGNTSSRARASTTVLAEQGNVAVGTGGEPDDFMVIYDVNDDSTLGDSLTFDDYDTENNPSGTAGSVDDDNNTRSSGTNVDSLTTAEIMGDLEEISNQLP